MKKLFCLLFLLTSSCLSPTVRQGITVPEDAGVDVTTSSMLSSDEISACECTNRCPIIEPEVKVITKTIIQLPSVARFPDVIKE